MVRTSVMIKKPHGTRLSCGFNKLMFGRRTIIESQVDVFVSWCKSHGMNNREVYLRELLKFIPVEDIFDITDDHKVDFLTFISDKYSTEYAVNSARISIDSFRKFYMARSRNMKMPVGRPPNVDKIEKAKEFRSKGLTIREVARALKADVKSVHTWIGYNADKLKLFKDNPVIHREG